MFTGIVQCTGRVVSLSQESRDATRLVVESAGRLDAETRAPRDGDSICVSGVCLTVTSVKPGAAGGRLSFDVVAETLRSTKLGDLSEGAPVNLEPAVAPNQPLGGHFMQGHVDALGEVTGLDASDDETRLAIAVVADTSQYLTRKGSVAVDGVSLTIAAMTGNGFEIALIPATLEMTSLGGLQPGDRVNIETDVIARTVVDLLRSRSEKAESDLPSDAGVAEDTAAGVTRETLEATGFTSMT